MTARNKLQEQIPLPVSQSLLQMGKKLRAARLRRNMTIAEVAERIGTGIRAVMDAEKGKASTGIVVYFALLWLYDLLDQIGNIAEGERDASGHLMEQPIERIRARKSKVRAEVE